MKYHLVATLSIAFGAGGAAFAQESDIEPEILTVEERISEGEHVFVMDMGINGSSQISILNADDLSLAGTIGAGTWGQMLITQDKSSVYTGSVYLRRYTYGEVEAVIHEWDAATLEIKREFIVSNKLAQTLSQKGIVNLSADRDYLVLQNATPATSVNIVDLEAGEDLVEIPTPGCWTAYPSTAGMSFSTLCGDGRVVKYTWNADGSVGEPAKSENIFDSDSNPLFGDAVRVGNDLVYTSYSGSLYLVDDTGEKPVLSRIIEYSDESWAPSGYNLMGYNPATDLLFVLMHADPADGSHKRPGEEIWAIKMESGDVVGKGAANGATSITVSQGETPKIFGIDHLGGVHAYEVTLGDSVLINETNAREGMAFFATILETDF